MSAEVGSMLLHTPCGMCELNWGRRQCPPACRRRRPAAALLTRAALPPPAEQVSQQLDQALIDEMFGGAMPKQEVQAQAFLKVAACRQPWAFVKGPALRALIFPFRPPVCLSVCYTHKEQVVAPFCICCTAGAPAVRWPRHSGGHL